MQEIRKNQVLAKPIYIDDPFPLLIIDNFISFEECEVLIKEGKEFINVSQKEIHGGRKMLNTETDEFQLLIKKSFLWKDFYARFTNKSWNLLFSEIKKSKSKDVYKNWLTSCRNIIIPFLISIKRERIYNFFMRKRRKNIKKSIDSPVRYVQSKILFWILFEDLVNYFYRKIITLLDLIQKKRRLSALFDYSVANEGYGRMIHRDSDSRVAVSLLYLNNLEDEVKGGNLEIYSSKFLKNKYEPLPNPKDLIKKYKIEPRAGRLVIFLNTANAYHSVDNMSYSKKGRHFIYGGYTLQSGFNNLIRKYSSKDSLTEYHLYR